MLETREQILRYAMFQYRGFAKRTIKSVKENMLTDSISFGCAIAFKEIAAQILGRQQKTPVEFLKRVLIKHHLKFKDTNHAIKPRV